MSMESKLVYLLPRDRSCCIMAACRSRRRVFLEAPHVELHPGHGRDIRAAPPLRLDVSTCNKKD